MATRPNEEMGITASSSSRRVYLLRRLAGGMLLLGIAMFFFDYTTVWFNIAFIAVAVLIWLFAGWIEGRRRRRNAVECDENGHAVKKVL